MGQALGLGAVLDPVTKTSTVSLVNLHRLEELAKKIRAPKWSDTFGSINNALANEGQALFVKECASCHDNNTPPQMPLAALGTDRNRAENFAVPVDFPPSEGGVTPSEVAIARLIGVIKQRAFVEKGFTPEQRLMLDGGRVPQWLSPKVYVARPLIAPWASAPYLHNNSVRTLLELLLPPDQRPKTFLLGTAKYDAASLGYLSEGSGMFDTSLAGNSNKGHNYGTGLTEKQRLALLEYLKGI
jgi:hypothetical protein